MKKNYCLKAWHGIAMCFIMMCSASLKAQISAYSFAESTEAYTAVVGTNSTAAGDDGSQNTIPLGFTFNLGGVNYTTFSLNTNGFIRLGTTVAGTSWVNTIGTASGQNPLIAAFWDDNHRNTGSIQYALSGTSPNQMLEIGWDNINIGGGGSTSPTNVASFKMRLYETTNVIEFIYGSTMNTAGALSASIGLSNTGGFHSATPATPSTSSAVTANNTISTTANLLGKKFIYSPPAPCTGTPTAGTTAGPTGACSGVNFTLSLTGATTGVSGITYQWQSSPDNVTYTNIAAATAASLTVSQTAATYYQCIVTCTASGLTATSSPLNVLMNSPTSCYCSSMPTSTADEEITNVTIGGLNNSSTCATVAPGPGSIATRYANYMSGTGAPAAAVIARTNSTSFSVTVGSCGTTSYNSGLAIFIDLNQNGNFTDAGEKVYSNGSAASIACVPATVVTANFTVPMTATLGLTAMRIIDAEFNSGDAITPCLSYGYGETEDYMVNIVDLPSAPPAPMQSASVPTCTGGTDLSIPGAPAAGDAWYWQASATGTSTATLVSGPYTVFLNGTYYARTYNATYGFWSATSSSITVTNIPVAPLPPAPTAISPSCLNTSISITPATGTTIYYWQGTASGGTSTALDASTPYMATASGTYYVAAYDAATSCWSSTNGLAVVIDTFVPPVPMSTTNPLNICTGSTSGIINATSSATLIASFGTSLSSPGTPVTFSTTVPALPAGAIITSTQLQVMGATAVGGSYRSEMRVALSGATTLAATQLSTITSAGLISPDPMITVPSLPLAGGMVTLTLSETFDDGGTDATFTEIRLVITYSLPPSSITWWDASSAGTQIGTGTSFESVGTAILPNTSTLGTYNFYTQATAGTCSSSRLTVPVIVNALPVVTASAPSTVCAGTMVTLSGGGASTYAWDNSVTNAVPFAASSTTTYNVIGTDVNGCTNTASTVLTVNPLPTVAASSTASVVCAGNSVTFTSGGTASTYVWSNGVTDGVPFTPSTTTTYVVTGTDANSCTNTASITVTVNALPVVTASSDTAGAVCAGTIVTLTGGGATSYAWNNGVSDAAAFATTTTTTYMVTGTDANSCTNTASIIVAVNALPTVTATSSATAAVCAGTMVTLTGAGTATSYIWNNGVIDATAFAATTTAAYTVTGTDANGCSSTASTTLTVNPLPTVTAASTATGTVCEGTMVTLTGSGATSYTWDNGVTDATTFATTATTTYMVIGTDGNGCTNTAMVTVNVNAAPMVTATSSVTGAVCAGTMATLTSGGTALTYMWDNGVTDAVPFATTTTTTYMVTGTDANSCTDTAMVTITVNALPVVTANTTAAAVCTGTMATLTGGGATSYVWDNSVMNGVAFTPMSTATYNVIGTDANGCMDTASTTVVVNSLPTVTASSSATGAVCAGTMVTLNGGGTATSYAWDNGVTNGIAFPASTTTTYIVVGTDANSCSNTASVMVTVNPLPSVTMSAFTAPVCLQAGPMALTAGSPSGGVYTGTGVVSGMFGPSIAGVGSFPITYTITDANSCSNSATSTITVMDCTGIEDGFASQEVMVYPNPSSGIVNITISNADYDKLQITVFNVQGKEVFSSTDTNVNGVYNKQINLEELSKGVYYIKLSAGANVKIQKLIIQ